MIRIFNEQDSQGKVKIIIFGSCSGTEPVPGRKHCSFAIEYGDRLYWFDAGEGCSYTAHLMGADLLSVAAIFISHPHMDHVGGLGNLLWNIRKINGMFHPLDGKNIGLFMPGKKTWEGIKLLLSETDGGFSAPFDINFHRISDGIIYDQNGLSVRALHNQHLPRNSDMTWSSFSFRIEAEGRSIVFSGDVGKISDIGPLLEGGCGLLLMETGHHRPEDACKYLMEIEKIPDMLAFNHHGRLLLRRGEAALEQARRFYPGNIVMVNDGDVFEI